MPIAKGKILFENFRVCSSYVTFFTKFEFASSSQIVPIFVYFTAKIGTICEEDADSNFVKKSNKTRTDSS